ncbi:MAG TPA: hypothetical protein VGL91_24145 [Acidobacteriota bacterium]|jgi:mannose-6-phosphate isomerase-like protein (cupin superfamily)
MFRKKFLLVLLFLAFAVTVALGEFGGRPGDVVIYLITTKGQMDFQTVPPGTTNDAATTANFKTLDTSKVPVAPPDQFPLRRQVLYEQPDELFQIGVDEENSVGKHRLFVVPVKIFVESGSIRPTPTTVGTSATYIIFPQGVDVENDIALETVKFLMWAPKAWPFIAPTTSRGPAVPPGMTGFEFILSTPGLIRLPFFIPWTGMRLIYPSGGWADGVDLKAIDQDPAAGNTTAILRLRPGRRTPLFRIAGNTHFYVLQGSVQLTPANASPITLSRDFYAFIPKNFAFRVSNPKQFDGPFPTSQ